MRKSPKWNGRFRKLMENGRLIHKFFPIGSVRSFVSTLFKSICMEISQFYKYFGRLFDTLYQTTFDVCVLYTFRDFKMMCSKYFGRCLSKLICTILFTLLLDTFKINSSRPFYMWTFIRKVVLKIGFKWHF